MRKLLPRNEIVCRTKTGKPLNEDNVLYLIEFFRLKATSEKSNKRAAQHWGKHYYYKRKLDAYRLRKSKAAPK